MRFPYFIRTFFRRPISATRGLGASLVVSACFLFPNFLNAAGEGFQQLSVTLRPQIVKGPLPSWETGSVVIDTNADDVSIPVPALASQDEIGSFALTVVFQDNGDGGPEVEWQPKEGESVLLSAGLGETGVALGLNARTLLISQSLALDGGTLRVSFTGRFARLISVTLRPARELGIATLGSTFNPALVGENEPVLTEADVSGADAPPVLGDTTEGNVVHAELSTLPRRLDLPDSENTVEFIVPVSPAPPKIKGGLLHVEVGGLDPESWIEITVNGESLGALGMAPFALNSPAVLSSSSGRLQIAGWRQASLFLPSRLWKDGDNSVILTLRRVAGDEGNPLFLRKAGIDFLFAPGETLPAATSTPISGIPLPSVSPIAPPTFSAPSTQTLSTGSLYGNPSPSLFRTTLPPPPALDK